MHPCCRKGRLGRSVQAVAGKGDEACARRGAVPAPADLAGV